MREAFFNLSTDWKEGINWANVRDWRLKRAHAEMEKAGLGALVLFYDENMRYVSSTLTPGWNRLKPGLKYVVLPAGKPPIVYEQGDIGFHLEVHNPWIPKENIRYSYVWIKGAVGPAADQQVNKFVDSLANDLEDAGVTGQPIGLDFIDINLMKEFNKRGIEWTDGMTPMMNARAIKSPDEVMAFQIVGSICDYVHYEITNFMKPGMTENEVAAFGFEKLYSIAGMEDVEDVIVSSGPNAWPNWRNFSDRMIRPGELVIIDLAALTWNGFKSCCYRTYCVGGTPTDEHQATYDAAHEWLWDSIEMVKPGASTAEVAAKWPSAMEQWGYAEEDQAAANNWGHGLGLAQYDPPVISRIWSLDHPVEIQQGMTFALETQNGKLHDHGVRLEEMLYVTETGYEMVTTYKQHEIISITFDRVLLDLTDERAEDPGLTGAKASWLARGISRRAARPPWSGSSGGVVATGDAAWPRGHGVPRPGGARLAISQEPLDADLADEVVGAARALGETLVVRSSSMLEGGGEWSGAFTSYLDLSPDETPVGVRGCWASAFTVHTLERYEASGVEPGSAPMAVLIQPALTPEFGGVAKLADGDVSVIGVVGSPVPLVQGWDPGVHAQVTESGVVKGDSAITVLGEVVIRSVADALRSAERAIGANTCEWAVAGGEVALLQLGRAEFREKQALTVPEEFASPEIGDLARLVRRFPGPLGEELVLPWAVASPASFLDGVDPIDVEPLEAFVEASQQARALTAEVWGARKADSSDRAAEAVRELRGDQPMRSVGAMIALRAPDADRSNTVLGLLATVRAALVEAGAVGRPEQAWHLSSQEIMDVLRAGRASEMRSRIGFDRWEPFDAAVVVAQGTSAHAVSAASGIGVGRLCFVDDPSTASDFRPRDVVVGLRPTPKLAPLLWDASTLITTGGGPAAHLFESARALAIPALAAVDLESLVGTDLVSASGRFSIAVDGNEGRLWVMPW